MKKFLCLLLVSLFLPFFSRSLTTNALANNDGEQTLFKQENGSAVQVSSVSKESIDLSKVNSFFINQFILKQYKAASIK